MVTISEGFGDRFQEQSAMMMAADSNLAKMTLTCMTYVRATTFVFPALSRSVSSKSLAICCRGRREGMNSTWGFRGGGLQDDFRATRVKWSKRKDRPPAAILPQHLIALHAMPGKTSSVDAFAAIPSCLHRARSNV